MPETKIRVDISLGKKTTWVLNNMLSYTIRFQWKVAEQACSMTHDCNDDLYKPRFFVHVICVRKSCPNQFGRGASGRRRPVRRRLETSISGCVTSSVFLFSLTSG